MQIDWITVTAQIVNFLILVWLLHRYLYGPIVRAMNDREERITSRLREASERKLEAEREAEKYQSQSEALEKEKERILTRVSEDAESTRHKLEDAARREVEQRRAEWLKQLDDEKQEFLHDMRRRSSEHVLALARRALSELADSQLEERLAAAFARQIEEIDPQLRERLAKACSQAGGQIIVKSRLALDAEAQRRMTRAVHKGISETAEVRYEQSEDTASGIELNAGSQTLAWTFARFLDELEQRLNRELTAVRAQNKEPPAA
jgi:F-type H+-transporting ATPase subunit b